MKYTAAILVLTLALAASAAQAGVVAVEDFESYGTGALANGSSGGTGWAAGWVVSGSAAPTIEAGGLSYSSGAINIDGGSLRLRQDVSSDQNSALFPALRALDTVQTGTLYMSMLLRPISTEGDDFYQFGLFSILEKGGNF